MTDELNGRVSVLIPARNEEANIERAVRSVRAQDKVLEIIAINDQSTDGTNEILERLRREIPRLRVIQVESLPEGWTGKANALATGVQSATGEWLLFTDADTEHRPASLTTLLHRAEAGQVDLLSISPGQRVPTWWEKAVIPLVYSGLARQFRFEDVSDPKSPAAAANGQYILIRKETYLRIGGHEAVRSEILDDVALARRAKSAGAKILFLPGAQWAETRMYRTFRAMWEGWTKNLYALFGSTLGNMAEAILGALIMNFLPALAFGALLIWFTAALVNGRIAWEIGFAAGVCVMALGVSQWHYRRALHQLGFDPSVARYAAAGSLLFSLLLLNSAIAHARGRVRWKGRLYPAGETSKGA